MTVTEAIDQIQGHSDNLPPADTAYSDRRTRILEWLKETVDDLRSRRPWVWKRSSTTLTVTASAGYVVVPSDFVSVGHEGGVFLPTTGDRLVHVSEQEIQELRQATWGATTVPEVYSIFGQDGTSGHPLLQFPPLSGDISVFLDYEKGAATLDESANNAKLVLAFPLQYHQSVLIPFLRAKALDSKGDPRSDSWSTKAEAAYKRMAIQERRGKDSTQQLRSFFGSSR